MLFSDRFLNRCFLFFLLLLMLPASAQDSIAVNKAINKGIDDMMHSRYASALETLGKTLETSRKNHWSRQEFLSVNNIGLTYYKMGDDVKALNHLLQAYEIAMSQGQSVNEMTVLNNIALIYVRDEKKEKAEEYLLKAYKIADEKQITTRIGYYASNLANLYLDMGRLADAENYNAIAFKTLEKDSRVLINARIVRNAIYQDKKLFAKAVADGTALLSEIEGRGFGPEASEINFFIAKAYSRMHEPEQTLRFLSDALRLNPEKQLRAKIFNLMAVAAMEVRNPEMALSAKDSVIALNKSISEAKNRELAENAALRFELSESRHNLESSQADAKDKQKIYLLSIALLVFVLATISVVFYKRSQLSAQRKIIQENSLKIKNLELDQEKQHSESLRREIEVKNQILSDKILFQTTRNELIEEVIDTLSSDPKVSGNPALLASARNLRSHLKDDARWEEFTSHFENVNNVFIKALKERHPDLVANDIRYLSFVYLNLNTKEIASLLNISPESCRKRKERLVKKLEISSSDNLYAYLSSLV